MQAYWLVARVLLRPPAEAAASQKWKIIYLQVLTCHPEAKPKSRPELVEGIWPTKKRFFAEFILEQSEGFRMTALLSL